MSWGCTTRGRTPAMIRTGYDLVRPAPSLSPAVDPALRPKLAPADDGDAFGEWLGHIAAGRIEVR